MRHAEGSLGRVLLRVVSVLALLGWMTVISGFSGQNAEESGSLSYQVSRVLAEGYNAVTGTRMEDQEVSELAKKMEHPVRKLAHMTEYAILAALTFGVLCAFAVYRFRYLLPVVFSLIYAALDEYHQTFVEGRAGQVRDVLIDTSGAALGMLLLYLLARIIERGRITAGERKSGKGRPTGYRHQNK